MNQREAKRMAYDRAANVVENALAEGWPYNDGHTDVEEPDLDRIAVGLEQIVSELRRRARAQGAS